MTILRVEVLASSPATPVSAEFKVSAETGATVASVELLDFCKGHSPNRISRNFLDRFSHRYILRWLDQGNERAGRVLGVLQGTVSPGRQWRPERLGQLE